MAIRITVSKARRVINIEQSIPFDCLSASELAQVEHDFAPDPYAVLRAKTINLAELLNCSEEEAERVILNRI